ncbi:MULTISPECIES: dUTP diphosphatase [Bacillus]|uniref:dUTP diphosphatase n=1 Tax=Bacillus TaxID=1386 RepID=UPI00142DD600|nr:MULTISPECIES: dUTP diphosphatase [Bacillus]MCY7581466.1 dUTP diphosphatase [Bacillus altitudinis]MCY7594426.1 dUTP diphosphatase [Bacillus altitudinis]
MNLEKMFKMQAELDNRIIREKGLEGQDLLPNTYVALITELGEFANEGRWFKHWSDNQKPCTEKEIECSLCMGTGDENYEMIAEDAEGNGGHEFIECEDCNGEGTEGTKNPLLEEYADCIHFFLSIAIKKGWQEDMHIPEESLFDFKKENFEGGLSGVYLEMQWRLLNSRLFKNEDVKNLHFQSAWDLFLEIGIVGFGFTLDQIEEAYMNKNAVNHKRQQEGY